MSSVSQYERHYDVQLLDDLHNYFPAILYDPLRFNTVRDLLSYIQDEMRARFDLFSAGLRGFYTTARPMPSAASAPPAIPIRRRPRQQSGASSNFSTPPIVTPPPSTAATASPAPRTPFGLAEVVESLMGLSGTGTINVTAQPSLSQNMLDALSGSTWASHPLFTIPTVYTTIRANLGPASNSTVEPSVVRPTREQIQSGSTIGPMEMSERECAICQEDIPIGLEVRTLRVCGHVFHTGCIDTWFSRDVHCPVCRHDIRDLDAAVEIEFTGAVGADADAEP